VEADFKVLSLGKADNNDDDDLEGVFFYEKEGKQGVSGDYEDSDNDDHVPLPPQFASLDNDVLHEDAMRIKKVTIQMFW
jgi:hypothetical protein